MSVPANSEPLVNGTKQAYGSIPPSVTESIPTPKQDPSANDFLKRLGVKNTNADAHKAVVDSYYAGWDADRNDIVDTTAAVDHRRETAQKLTNHFYDMVTDFYEYGWGQSFHFAVMWKNLSFDHAVARHEDYLALKLGLKRGQKCLDVGCGVGGPMREIASFSGSTIVGINNNAYQVERVGILAERSGLSALTSAIKGDFTAMPFESESFDAAYSIEACVHAPRLEMVYGEVFRCLKAGSYFANYEWVTTEKYDESNLVWKKIMHDLEEGNSIAKLYTIPECLQALKNVGFEIIEYRDLAAPHPDVPKDKINPWYAPLTGKSGSGQGTLRDFRMSPFGRAVTDVFVTVIEGLKIAPPGTRKVSKLLNLAADQLVAAGELELFTPMFFFLARKPLTAAKSA
ncbi:Delta(24)-sterol C-methyltransferase [Nowakowskiella sp. JEL0407]|nr:Delta(24)-sterol C-methyltransferase [Nowakowskiella sp. JEL0407]